MIYMNVTAEDKNNVTALLKSDGKLNAVKYLHQRNYGDLKECLRYVNDLNILLQNKLGTINWFSVDVQLPEIGEYVLIYNTEGAALIGRRFTHDWVALFADGEQEMKELTATHWAYINPPKIIPMETTKATL